MDIRKEKSFMIADTGGAEYRVGLHSEAKGGKTGNEKKGGGGMCNYCNG